MRKTMWKVVLLCIWLLSCCGVGVIDAQSRPNVSRIEVVTREFAEITKQFGAVKIHETYKCTSWYRKDWNDGTYMQLYGFFWWTDGFGGTVRLRSQTNPLVLEGYRLPVTDIEFNTDGSIPEHDIGYYIRYQEWTTRPCADLESLLRTTKLSILWIRLLEKHGGVAKYAYELKAMGFDTRTGLPTDMYVENTYMNMTINDIVEYMLETGELVVADSDEIVRMQDASQRYHVFDEIDDSWRLRESSNFGMFLMVFPVLAFILAIVAYQYSKQLSPIGVITPTSKR